MRHSGIRYLELNGLKGFGFTVEFDELPRDKQLGLLLVEMTELCDRSFAPSRAALEQGSSGYVEGRQLRDLVDRAKAMIAEERAI